VERAIGASPPETLSIDPQKSLYDACQKMLTSRARRIPLIEGDTVTKREAVISVMTQYRILKFVAVNLARWTNLLQKKIGDLRLGTYEGLATASMESTIFDVISLMSEKGVASIPIVDENGTPAIYRCSLQGSSRMYTKRWMSLPSFRTRHTITYGLWLRMLYSFVQTLYFPSASR